MADKNKNGIDDSREFLSPFGRIQKGGNPRQVPEREGFGRVLDTVDNGARQFTNFLGDLGGWFGGRDASPSQYGAGDYAFGVTPGLVKQPKSFGPRRTYDELAPVEGPPSFDMPGSFMDFLKEALQGSAGVGRISYDPQRADARNRSSEYDARLAAMYGQLQNRMRDDNTALQSTYQGAIDDSAARNAAAQQQIQAASNAADDRNAQVLANLGIEQAQGNIVNEGRDLNTQTANAVADAAARGQISGDALSRNQQSAAQAGNSLVGAVGLEGNLQRARVQNELSQLLAQYDMQEQEANRQAQQQSFAQAMGLANAAYDDAWRRQGYQDDMTKFLMQQSAQRTDPMQYSMNFIGQLQQAYPDLDMDQIIKLLGPAASIGKLAN